MTELELYELANAAGRKAVAELGEVSWYPCGFANISIKPANSKFAKFLTSNGIAHKDSYRGGVAVYVHDYNQSMVMKETYAYAFANVLSENGIKASASSRMD